MFLFSVILVTSDTGHDTSSSCIRQKVTLKRENKVPPTDTIRKKKKTETFKITSNINTFANIANNCMSELCQNKDKESEMDTFKVALQFIPEDFKLSFMIDVLRVSDIYRKGKRPLISETDDIK